MSNLSEACPLCHNDRLKDFSYKDQSLYFCPSCSFRFLPTVTREKVRQKEMFQAPFEFWSTPENYFKAQTLFHYYFEKRLTLLKRFQKLPLQLLDVGCGYGLWLKFLKEREVSCEGLEPAPLESELITYKVSFEDFEATKKYNCLTLIDVLEHVAEPEAFLKKGHDLLEDQGLLYVQVPSVFGFKIPWGHDPGLPFHLWHFEYSSLKLLLEKTGFEILYFETGILGVVGRELKQGKIHWWQKLFWKFSSLIKRGNRLQVLARRKEHL